MTARADLRLLSAIGGYRDRVAIDELPPRRDSEATAGDDATSAHAAESSGAGDEGAGQLEVTQAFDVERLIALEKSVARRAVSADEMDELDSAADEAAPVGRRARRETAAVAKALDLAAPADAPQDAPQDAPADPPRPATAALAWIDPATIAATPTPAALNTSPQVPAAPPLLPTQGERRRGAAAPLVTAAALALAYLGGCAFWPLDNVAPEVSAATMQPAPGHPLGLTWPEDGTAAVGADGLGTVAALNSEPVPMASIAKLVTVLMILEKAPLGVGEDGPAYDFAYSDSQLYWQYRYQNESALDVPIDGTLTQRQLLEGILIGSANNYIDRLTTELWGSKDAFVQAVPEWLRARGLTGITMVDPSGIDPRNTATPTALIKLADAALADPVVSEIVAMRAIELPGAGKVENTNPLLGEPGVVGVKTGTLLAGSREQWNLLTAKDITIGQTTVRVYSAVLGQPNEQLREDISRDLLAQVERSLQPGASVAAGTAVANVSTRWGARAEIVAAEDASVVLWDRGLPAVESDYDIEVDLADGAEVGELTATGPFDSTSVPLVLEGDVPGPDLFWRLTHPLDLIGLQ
jgi:D-alanyl-D-alanine carboxypeptidase (penicillin-binding protein 5/6)